MTPQEQPDSQDRADELANLIKSELGDSQALPNNADSGKNILNPPKVGQDSQAGDEQTETDEPIWLDVHDFTEQQVKRILKWHNETRERYARQQTVQVLDELRMELHLYTAAHDRYMRDEALKLIAALRVGLEGK